MARFTQYPIASTGDYADATTFLIANEGGEIKQASLEGINDIYGCGTKCANVTIPSAEVLALNTTPKELVAAQGLGTIIVPIAVVGKVVNNTVPYATNTTFIIYENASSVLYTSNAFINTVASSPVYHQFQQQQPSITSTVNIQENTALKASVSMGDPTAGDGDLEILVYYRLITV